MLSLQRKGPPYTSENSISEFKLPPPLRLRFALKNSDTSEFISEYSFEPAASLTSSLFHREDIAVVFGTSSSLSSAQTALVKEVQARWAAFARTGNPTPSSYPTWPALDSAGGLQILQLGNTSNGGSLIATSQRTEACKLYAST